MVIETTVAGNVTLTSNSGNGNVTFNCNEFHVSGDVTANRVWNAVYNDLAEYMEKANPSEEIKAGDVVAFTDDGKVTKAINLAGPNLVNRVAGIVSGPETMGYVLGGAGLSPDERVPVALTGRVYLNIEGLDIQTGDLIALKNNGTLEIVSDYTRAVIGKATRFSEDGKVYVLVR